MLAPSTCDLPGCNAPCTFGHNYCCRSHALEAEVLTGSVDQDAQPGFAFWTTLQETRGGGEVSTGLNDEQLSRLTRTMIVRAHDGTCCICLQEWSCGDAVVRLPCGQHEFHSDCVVPWLQRKPTCPMCLFDCRLPGTRSQSDMAARVPASNNPTSEHGKYEADGKYPCTRLRWLLRRAARLKFHNRIAHRVSVRAFMLRRAWQRTKRCISRLRLRRVLE